ncbi:unnamed protein product [Tilletia laevis]|uniref:Uncharacterized protein n=2 Tax=Tilletia TaxID=13289 RepID=A0A177VBE5_9BASI|nr:hypothetical protein CF336_g1238 [Tilletia laevis]KAE8262810.1 hypothetical protein A4X03_0g2164 [Tilletia caries]CAD6976390.1 unnamed protein product [Tilletia controversa]KAE8208062.1 hypothetical protein CF335_g693 [Tilletia laevis]CAD6893213.1 unnamed protein product [Tilletia caries]
MSPTPAAAAAGAQPPSSPSQHCAAGANSGPSGSSAPPTSSSALRSPRSNATLNSSTSSGRTPRPKSAIAPPNVQLELSLAGGSTSATSSTTSAAQMASLSRALGTGSTSTGSGTSRLHNGGATGVTAENAEVWRSSAAKRAEKAWAVQSEKSLNSDAKFKKYAVLIERTLATFESVSEWADFISFLARLLKVLQTYPQYNSIPRKLVVAKRLSQCLNPALPSGVHTRALDVYAHILKVIGPDGLRRDLQIWSPGLLPHFEYASTTVRPSLLTLLEKHYLPLKEDLRPITRAFILALLPGLEEETNEFFDKVLSILDHLSESVSSPFFLQNIWLILVGSPKARLSALNYLSRRLPNLNEEVDPAKIVGRDLGLMVRGFASALDGGDDSAAGGASTALLVRRAALELLVTQLRIDSTTFQHACRQSDRILLVRAALAVVLRRDLSLNRRLYTWLLGPEEGGDQVGYLRKNSLELVRLSLREDFYAPISPGQDRQRPYRIFISLLDKYEIGHALTEVLVLDSFQAVALQAQLRDSLLKGSGGTKQEAEDEEGAGAVAQSAAAISSIDDLLTTARMLFEAVDPFITYRQFFLALRAELGGDALPLSLTGPRPSPTTGHPRSSLGSVPSASAVLYQNQPISAVKLLQYILDTFGVHDEVERLIHLPMLFPVLVELAETAVTMGSASSSLLLKDNALSPALLRDALHLARSLLALIPARVFVRIETIEGSSNSSKTTHDDRLLPSLLSRRSHSTTSAATAAALADSAPFFFLRHATSFYGSGPEASAGGIAGAGELAMAKYVGFQHERIVARLLALVANLSLKSVRSGVELGGNAEQAEAAVGAGAGGSRTLLALELAQAMLDTLDKSEDRSVTSLFSLQSTNANEALGEEGSASHQVFQKVDWSGAEAWKGLLLHALPSITDFAHIEPVFSVLFAAARCRALRRPIALDSREIMDQLSGKLFEYLHPGLSMFHLRAVQLLWELESFSGHAHLQSALTRKVTAMDVEERRKGYEVFGTVWKLTDESSPASAMLNLPLTIVLDALKSADVELRQTGETWLRVNLRTYARLLDALLPGIILPGCIRADLGSSTAPKTPKRRPELVSITKVGPDLKVERLVYDAPFDLQTVNATLATLSAMARFGGQGFTKAIRASSASKSTDSRLSKHAANVGAYSYQDLITDTMVTLLRSDFEREYALTAALSVTATHAHAVEIVQTIAARATYDPARLVSLETTLVECLLVSVQLGSVVRQNKLLHALHSVIHQRSRFWGGGDAPRSEMLNRRLPSGPIDTVESSAPVEGTSTSRTALVPHKLLLPLLKAALSDPSSRPVLSHWADFVLMTAPYYRKSQSAFLLPLQDALCSLLRSSLSNLSGIYITKGGNKASGGGLQRTTETTETEIMLFINMTERVLLQCLGEEDARGETENADVAAAGLSEKTGAAAERGPDSAVGAGAGTGILGLVTNVFSSDSPSSPSTGTSIPSASSRNLQQTIAALHAVWMFARASGSAAGGAGSGDPKQVSKTASGSASVSQSRAHMVAAHVNIASKVQARARRGLEKLYSSHSGEVVETLVACWYSARPGPEADKRAQATFEILAVLAPSAQIVVSFLCDVIAGRTTAAEKGKRAPAGPIASDAVLFQFLEIYLARLEGLIAVQVWPVVIVLVKDLLNAATSNRSAIFPCLRCLTAIGEKMSLTAALEDRRLRRDLQDAYAKLFDTCILIAGRSFESSTWIRRTRDASSEQTLDADGETDEKLSAAVTELSGSALIESINVFLGERGMAALRTFQYDTDRVNALCANVVYYIVTPAMRGKGKTLDVDHSVIRLSREMAKLPGTVKTWRSTIGDAFADNRFFTVASRSDADEWAPLIFSLMNQDKERLIELIGKVNAAPSANIFTNRETEMLGRALNLRRLSYVIFTSTKDHFLTQLPSIQEKVVDIMRAKAAEPVQAEVYLCMRVLLCRFSQQHLAPFWPVLLTELMRLLESMTEELPTDGSDQLQLVFSACKFLDLLLTLQTEDFQIHQWLFVTDTADVMYPPAEWVAESIMDRVAAVVNERRPNRSSRFIKSNNNSPRPGSSHRMSAAPAAAEPEQRPLWQSSAPETPLYAGFQMQSSPHRTLRKPLLGDVRELESLDGLVPFFNSVSLAAYEGQVGAVGGVDWEAVERGLAEDMFTFTSDVVV